jgi:hypothetical protein
VAERSRAATATGRSFVAEAIVRHIAKLTIAFVAKRSHQPATADERSPSNAIVPMRRPWLPDHAAAAGPSMTLGACKVASSATFS